LLFVKGVTSCGLMLNFPDFFWLVLNQEALYIFCINWLFVWMYLQMENNCITASVY